LKSSVLGFLLIRDAEQRPSVAPTIVAGPPPNSRTVRKIKVSVTVMDAVTPGMRTAMRETVTVMSARARNWRFMRADGCAIIARTHAPKPKGMTVQTYS
jgi:hypothetical protein